MIRVEIAVAIFTTTSLLAGAVQMEGKDMIDFTKKTDLEARKPLLIAHRGGVVTPDSPECSLGAIRLAAQQGYDMVELDVRETASHDPVVFHDKTLQRAAGRNEAIRDLSIEQVLAIRFLGTEEKIPSLDEALALCRELNLGVMLDIKTEGTDAFWKQVITLLDKYNLGHSAVTISSRPRVREKLKGRALLRFVHENKERWFESLQDPLEGDFWFGQPAELPSEAIPLLQERGLLVIPAINAFRYLPSSDYSVEQKDAERLIETGVDGFQIDSRYQHFFGLPKVPE